MRKSSAPGPRPVLAALSIVFALLMPAAAEDAADPILEDTQWFAYDETGAAQVYVHIFWAQGCPFCEVERAFLRAQSEAAPWLRIREYEVADENDNLDRLIRMNTAAGGGPQTVPTTFICGLMTIGYNDDQSTGAYLMRQAERCRTYAAQRRDHAMAPAPAPVKDQIAAFTLPVFGTVDLTTLSIPLLTLTMASVDAFNPCGLFVLLFLMSMMIRAHSRSRMAIVGVVFVACWGALYYLFMAAWLNLFQAVGDISLITGVAGAIALVMGAINIKDFAGIQGGPSLSIPARYKTGLFAQMGTIVRGATLSMPKGGRAKVVKHCGMVCQIRKYLPLLASTAVLTVLAGGYALLCTSGFALAYTRALTLHDLPQAQYYLYLVLYVSIYVIPQLIIVAVFVFTLSERKLKGREGRVLKLLAGTMLLMLGTVLVAWPELLKNPLTAVGLLLAALIVTAIVAGAQHLGRAKRRARPARPAPQH